MLSVFGEEEKVKLFEFLMQEDKDEDTAIHLASDMEHEGIVIFLLTEFGKQDQKQLVDYLMKENGLQFTAFDIAVNHGNEKIFTLLFQKLMNAFHNLRQITQNKQ